MHLLIGGECVYEHTYVTHTCWQYTCQHRHQDVSYDTNTTHMPVHVCHVSTCAYICQMSVWVSLCEHEYTCEPDNVWHMPHFLLTL